MEITRRDPRTLVKDGERDYAMGWPGKNAAKGLDNSGNSEGSLHDLFSSRASGGWPCGLVWVTGSWHSWGAAGTPRGIAKILDALIWGRKCDGFAGDAALSAAGDHQNRVVKYHKAQALRALSDLATDGRRQWRGRSGMREQADGDAEVQSMQGRLHMIRGECFHSDRPREAAQDSQSVELLRTMDPMCRTTCMALSWTCVPWHDTYAPLQRLAG